MKTTRIAAPLLALAALAVACGGGSEAASPSRSPSSIGSSETGAPEPSASDQGDRVTIQDFTFAPKKVSVSVGDTVTWTNADDILHTVTSGVGQKQGVPGVTKDKDAKPNGVFDQELDLDDTFEFTFDKPGAFKYFCAIHPGMVGTVIVE